MSPEKVRVWSRGQRRMVSVPVERDLVELPAPAPEKPEAAPLSLAVARFKERLEAEMAPLLARRKELMTQVHEIDRAINGRGPNRGPYEPPKHREPGARRTSPMWAVLAQGPATAREIAEAIDCNLGSLRTYLSREVRRGTIRAEKKGGDITRYGLPEKR